MWHTFNQGREGSPLKPRLMNIVFIGLFYGLYSEGFDRLWVKHLLDHFELPIIFGNNQVAFFAVLRVAGTILTILAVRFVEKRVDSTSPLAIGRAVMIVTGSDLRCIAWVCAIAASSSKPEPLSSDKCLTQRPNSIADSLGQPEIGFAGARDSPLDVWTGGCHWSSAGRTGCRCDRFSRFSSRLTRDVKPASDPRAVLYRTRQLTIQG